MKSLSKTLFALLIALCVGASPALAAYKSGYLKQHSTTPNVWIYKRYDPIDTILGADYFSDFVTQGGAEGDIIILDNPYDTVSDEVGSIVTQASITNTPAATAYITGGAAAGVTAGTVTASKAVVVDSNKDIGDFRNLDAVNFDAGASGTAGSVDIFPTTASKGKIALTATANTNNDTLSITNAAQAAARTYTIPDFGASANFVLADANDYKVDGIAISPVKCVDVAVTAALLDSAGTVPVITGVSGDQWKIREVYLVGGGTSFGAGGDRLISLTDGTTTWTTIANADIESAPSATLRWGDAKVPFLTGTSNTKSASNQNIRFAYSGGTTDHSGTGSITFGVCAEKTD